MNLVFAGDRYSKTAKLGKLLKKVFCNFILVLYWDGCSSLIYFQSNKLPF